MAEVNATIYTTVNVSKKELFRGLCRELGVKEIISGENGFFRMENDKLYYFKDVSTRGTEHYECVKMITDARTIRLYKLMLELQELL